jgi:hypothetical protein
LADQVQLNLVLVLELATRATKALVHLNSQLLLLARPSRLPLWPALVPLSKSKC